MRSSFLGISFCHSFLPLQVWYVVDKVAEGVAWPFSVGHITEVGVGSSDGLAAAIWAVGGRLIQDLMREKTPPPFSILFSQGLMREKLWPASPTTLGLVCGPPGLVEHAAKPGYEAMGYAEDNLVVF